jgi:hypothetical protein
LYLLSQSCFSEQKFEFSIINTIHTSLQDIFVLVSQSLFPISKPKPNLHGKEQHTPSEI